MRVYHQLVREIMKGYFPYARVECSFEYARAFVCLTNGVRMYLHLLYTTLTFLSFSAHAYMIGCQSVEGCSIFFIIFSFLVFLMLWRTTKTR